jgi:phage shock protein PspC (stress-responsive transcriptional regulator)
MISGVCGGLAEYFDIDVTIVRLAVVALAVLSSGAVVLVYIVLAIVVPESPLEGQAEPARAMTGDEIAAGARSFGEDVRVAAERVADGVRTHPSSPGPYVEPQAPMPPQAGPHDASAVPPEAGQESSQAYPPASSTEPIRAPQPPSAAPAADGHGTRTGGLVIGVLLVAIGATLLLGRIVNVDFFALGWTLGWPALIILIGVLIIVRAGRRR